MPDSDLAGIPRIIDGDLDGTATVDIGAYEFLPGDVKYDGRVNILSLEFLGCRKPAPTRVARGRQLDATASVALDLSLPREGSKVLLDIRPFMV